MREEKLFEALGIRTVIQADARKPLAAAASPAETKKVRDELEFQARFAVSQAESAIKALAELVLRPSALDQLGGESAVRTAYLDIPDVVQATRATAFARRLYKEARKQLDTTRLAGVEARLRDHAQTRLAGRTLESRYPQSLTLLATSIDLMLTVDKTLEARDIERLADADDGDLQAVVDDMLASARRARAGRAQQELDRLAERIRALPHVELLAGSTIAETVAPYFGGLDRALKKNRAKSALVAVEERAREAKYQDDVIKFNEKRAEFADVSRYYPLARSIARQLVLYVGPTNSGKTWRALNDLATGESGVYLAPLRLLALEGQEELEKRGRTTAFVTGEERDPRPGARFVSSTIEMLDTDTEVDAVVVDEVQLLADERRGWAWLSAVIGAPARKIIMTGSPDCIDMVKGLAAFLGEPLTIHTCERHNELRVAPEPMRLREVRPGMAIVCFSRRDVMRLKALIEENSDHKVAVVYGNLSPQVRREEARRFRSGEATVLVATDAIAMGLNLPISEVLFYATEKFNGEAIVPLSTPEIRQIGGRAGRYGFGKFGVVNALTRSSLSRIRAAISEAPTMLEPRYYVAPGQNHVRIISEVLGTTSLERILTFFDRTIEFSDQRFLRANIDDLSLLASFVDERLPNVDAAQRLMIACAPVSIRSERALNRFLNDMLPLFNANPGDAPPRSLALLVDSSQRFAGDTARSQAELEDAEDYLKTLTTYAWLAYRYPDVFTQLDACEASREAANGFIERSLRRRPERARRSGTAATPKRRSKR